MNNEVYLLKEELALAEKELENKKEALVKAQASIKEEAIKKIVLLTETAYAAVNEAERIADEAGVSFEFSVSYGMGGTYHGEPSKYHGEGWVSSSQTC